MNKQQISLFIWFFHGIWLLAMFILVFRGGVRHDYIAYVKQWSHLFSGSRQWVTTAYGPLHKLLGYGMLCGPLAPKFLMTSAFAISNILMLMRLQKKFEIDNNAVIIYLLAIPLNGLIIFIGFWYGLNDVFIASFIIGAILARLCRKFWLLGVLIGMAALIKFYPLLLLPFLSFDEKHIRVRPVVAALIVFISGICFSWLLWGDGIFSSLSMNFTRTAKLLSILASFKVHPGWVGGETVVNLLIAYNSVAVCIVLILSIWVLWWYGVSWLSSFIAGTLAILVTQKVGHPQLFIPWLTSIAMLPLMSSAIDMKTAWICMPFAFFLSVFQAIYTLGNRMFGPWLIVRQNVGFFAFFLGVLTIAMILNQHRGLPKRQLKLAW